MHHLVVTYGVIAIFPLTLLTLLSELSAKRTYGLPGSRPRNA